MTAWDVVILEPVTSMLNRVGIFLPQLFGSLLILLVGWLIARILSGFSQKVLDQVKINDLSGKMGLNEMLSKGGVSLSFSGLLASLVYWVIMLVVFAVTVDSIGLSVAAKVLEKTIEYVPNVVTAVFIALVGMFVANLFYGVIKAATSNANIARAELLATIAKIAILLFTTIMTLDQLKISTFFVSTTFQIFFGALCLALALAFGIGGKDLAAKILWDFYNKQNMNK